MNDSTEQRDFNNHGTRVLPRRSGTNRGTHLHPHLPHHRCLSRLRHRSQVTLARRVFVRGNVQIPRVLCPLLLRRSLIPVRIPCAGVPVEALCRMQMVTVLFLSTLQWKQATCRSNGNTSSEEASNQRAAD